VPGARWETRLNGAGGITHSLVSVKRSRYQRRRTYAMLVTFQGPTARWHPQTILLWLPIWIGGDLAQPGYRVLTEDHPTPLHLARAKREVEQRVARAIQQVGWEAWDRRQRHHESPPCNEECDAYFEAQRAGLPPPAAAVAAWFASIDACLS
jgi:hypothetical protein